MKEYKDEYRAQAPVHKFEEDKYSYIAKFIFQQIDERNKSEPFGTEEKVQ